MIIDILAFYLLFSHMNALKKIVIVLLLLLGSTTIFVWMLARTINPDYVKETLNSQLTKLTQQKSKVEGEVSWQVFPSPGIQISQIQIGEENSNYRAQISHLFLSLNIMPLFRGNLSFHEISVDGFKILINADAPLNKLRGRNQEAIATNPAFHLERFLLSHGQIIIRNPQKTLTFSDLLIGGDEFSPTHFPIQLKAKMEVKNGQEQVMKGLINFKGSVKINTPIFDNPVLSLANIPIEGELSMQKVRFMDLSINKIQAHLSSRMGVLQLNPLALSLYKGESLGKLRYEWASKKLKLNQTATNLDSAKLSYDLWNKYLVKGNLDFTIHADINTEENNWLKNASGEGNLTIKEGALQSFNLNKVIENTSAHINKIDLNGKTQNLLELAQFENADYFKGTTPFKLLTVHYFLNNAKLDSDSLVLQTEKLQLKGFGTLNLLDNRINSSLNAKIALFNNEIDKIQQMLGGSFPLLISGTLTEPTVLPDLKKINPILTNLWLRDTIKKPVQVIEKTVNTILNPPLP